MTVHASTIVELAEMRAFLNITDSTMTDKDTLIESLLDAYNDMIEDYLGVPCINSTYTAEKYDGDGTDTLFLKRYPIVSVTSLTLDAAVMAAADYLIYADKGFIRYDNGIFTKDYQNISITYVAGHGAARTNVSNVLKLALKTWVARVYKAEIVDFSQRFDESSLANIKSQMMPWDVKQMLEPYTCRRWGR
jgi:uncharacterized phiE125 gp8 family phage protein